MGKPGLTESTADNVDVANIDPRFEKALASNRISFRKQPEQNRASETYNLILEVTSRFIEENGLDQLTTNKIAKLANLSVGTLYRYFENKESILFSLALRRTDRTMEIFQQVPPQRHQSCIDWQTTLIDRIYEIYAGEPHIVRHLNVLATIPEIRHLHQVHMADVVKRLSGGYRHFSPTASHEDTVSAAEVFASTVSGVMIRSSELEESMALRLVTDLKKMLALYTLSNFGPVVKSQPSMDS